jgi:predicted PhzF superfamily epimerase YddE/YHI9
MEIEVFHVDAFTEVLFRGNPAAICPLREWLPDGVMQAIARETNLSETAFFVPTPKGYHIRWFSPGKEVDLCGHATLASAFILFTYLGERGPEIVFHSGKGVLRVRREEDAIILDFPALPMETCIPDSRLVSCLGKEPLEAYAADDLLLLFSTERDILGLTPDFPALAKFPFRGVIVTAPGEGVDFVSRFFAPALSVDEDPVTGSAHCELVPFWAERLGKQVLTARQVSRRGGTLVCRLALDRVFISGKATLFSRGRIYLPDGVE